MVPSRFRCRARNQEERGGVKARAEPQAQSLKGRSVCHPVPQVTPPSQPPWVEDSPRASLLRSSHLQLLLLLLHSPRPRHLRAALLVGHAAGHCVLFGDVDLGHGVELS